MTSTMSLWNAVSAILWRNRSAKARRPRVGSKKDIRALFTWHAHKPKNITQVFLKNVPLLEFFSAFRCPLSKLRAARALVLMSYTLHHPKTTSVIGSERCSQAKLSSFDQSRFSRGTPTRCCEAGLALHTFFYLEFHYAIRISLDNLPVRTMHFQKTYC